MLAVNLIGFFRGNPGSHSTTVVVVQSVEDGNRDEPSSPWPGWQGNGPPWNPLSNPLVWPCSVEVVDVFLDCAMKVPSHPHRTCSASLSGSAGGVEGEGTHMGHPSPADQVPEGLVRTQGGRLLFPPAGRAICNGSLGSCNHEKLNASAPGWAPRVTVAFLRATST